MKTFEGQSSELNISDVIKRLHTDESEITFGDHFLEVGEYRFIHQMVENYHEYKDYKLSNGIEVVVMRKNDFDYNSQDTTYRRIVNIYK